ncbi:MAG: peptidylprolyl isomerase [Blastocatellia bacterium]
MLNDTPIEKTPLPRLLILLSLVLPLSGAIIAQPSPVGKRPAPKTKPAMTSRIPDDLMLRFLRLEDERNFNGDELTSLLAHTSPAVRARAALALGRIGDIRAIGPLADALEKDTDTNVRRMAAFARGEIESPVAAAVFLKPPARADESLAVRGRIVEALGKIGGLPANAEALGHAQMQRIAEAILAELPAPAADAKVIIPAGQKELNLLAITALMRVRAPEAVPALAQQLRSHDADIRADAANALFRIRQPIEPAIPALLECLADKNADVRANAARALGQIQDKKNIDIVRRVYGLLNDPEPRVRIHAMRGVIAMAGAGNTLAATLLGAWTGQQLKTLDTTRPPTALELEIAPVLHTLKGESVKTYAVALRNAAGAGAYPEIETALARIDPALYIAALQKEKGLSFDHWRKAANVAQALGEIVSSPARELLQSLLRQVEEKTLDARALPAILRALAKQTPGLEPALLRRYLNEKDEGVCAAAAGLLSAMHNDENRAALISAWQAHKDDTSSGAKAAILRALAKYYFASAAAVWLAAAADRDHLFRRQVYAIAQQNGFAAQLPAEATTIHTGHDEAFYQRVLRRMSTRPRVTLQTKRGRITLELFTDEAPLTVDSFLTLAARGYFNGLTFHRVVPNFVIQGGDPRGDGDGGPGYRIRCEINTRMYKRGALGMALSGKDTGGSQFFITHAPQPHLDGGYTVFGQVLSGMEIVDQIRRGEVIEKVIIGGAAR